MKKVDFNFLFDSLPNLYLVVDPNLSIVAVSNSYLEATATKREDILNRNIFDVFPDDPHDMDANGQENLMDSFNRVKKTLSPHKMPDQKYSIYIESIKKYEERWWSPTNFPVLKNGKLEYIYHRVEDITERIEKKKYTLERLKELTDKINFGE